MDKIICDVCGTSYPESSGQCPICGYVNSTGAKAAESEYTRVRGGRFSNNNVRRRSPEAVAPANADNKEPSAPKNNGSNLILGVSAVILIAVLLIVAIIFIVKIIGNDSNALPEDGGESVATTQEADVTGACRELHTDAPYVELSTQGQQFSISVTTVPSKTSDAVTYTSMDEQIITVDANGHVTAVSGGESAVAVRCGEQTLIITVNCTFGPDIPADATWSMNRKDITLSKKGETWDLYSKNSTIEKKYIKWTSDDDSVATIENGVVKAVGKGKTKVHGECNGIAYSCTIRCNLPAEADDKDEEDTPEETKPAEGEKSVKISHTDVTLKPNGDANEKSFSLYLRDGDGNKLDVTWKASEDGYVTIEGNKITAVKAGKSITVSTTYEGETYKCTLRLK